MEIFLSEFLGAVDARPMRARRAPRRFKAEKILRPVHPNAGIEAIFRKKIIALLDEMQRSIEYWISANYRKEPPAIAQDEMASKILQRAMRALSRRWLKRFDEMSIKLGKYFAKDISKRSDRVLKKILKDGGFSVEFRMTKAQRDVLNAIVQENVALIKSIPRTHLQRVEGAVMRSVQTGRDLHSLTEELKKGYGITKRRAIFIARDQNNKATALLTRARHMEIGISECIWMHSHAGKTPRPSHVKAGKDKVRYNVAEGWLDPAIGKRIWPGTEINCFPSDTSIDFADGVEIAYRHRYCGDLAFFITDSGKSLRGTPNHPILTQRGWVPIQLVNEYDYVFEIADHAVDAQIRPGFSPSRESDIDNGISSIGKVFDSIRYSGSADIVVGGNFHGDITDRDVDVVFPARPLRIANDPAYFESIHQFAFTVTNYSNFGISLSREFEIAGFGSTPGLIGAERKFFSSIDSLSCHSNSIGVASRSSNTTDSNDGAGNGSTIDIINSGQCQNTLSRFMLKPQRVAKIGREVFDGHVFNLQTGIGWYIAGGIVAHNCRCVSKPVLKGIEP